MPLFIHNTTYNKGEIVEREATMTATRNHQAGTMYFSNENLFECGSLSHSRLSSDIIKIFYDGKLTSHGEREWEQAEAL